MRPVISLITAAACLLHFGLGCCAHHAHAGDDHVCECSVSHGQDEDHCHSHEHDHDTPADTTPDEPADHHGDCHETHCTFLVTGKTTIAPELLSAPLLFATLDAVVATADSTPAIWQRDTGDPLWLPVRLHLLHQVLLI